jgi:hypothetical protein
MWVYLFLANFHTFAFVSTKFGKMVEGLPGVVLEILKLARCGVKAILFPLTFSVRKAVLRVTTVGSWLGCKGKYNLMPLTGHRRNPKISSAIVGFIKNVCSLYA